MPIIEPEFIELVADPDAKAFLHRRLPRSRAST